MKLYFSLTLAVIILVMDLLTKRWVELNLTYGQQIMITEFFNLVLTYNAGAAFSFLSDASAAAMVLEYHRCSRICPDCLSAV